jgi:16S rRNA (cytidine1402-2'-O)-methyltransferase
MKSETIKKGVIFLIPVGLGSENLNNVLPAYNASVLKNLDIFIVENVRTARRFLRSVGYQKSFEEVTFHILDKHTQFTDIPTFLRSVLQGDDVGLLSEAGNPCIADPGNIIVKLAHEQDIRVVPMVGPNSILMALIASGFNGQNFAFNGYLPVNKSDRQARIKELQYLIINKDQTQIFMETPFRNNALLEVVLSICHDNLLLCIASNISQPDELIKTKTIKEWKRKTPDLHKKPSVFLLYKNN